MQETGGTSALVFGVQPSRPRCVERCRFCEPQIFSRLAQCLVADASGDPGTVAIHLWRKQVGYLPRVSKQKTKTKQNPTKHKQTNKQTNKKQKQTNKQTNKQLKQTNNSNKQTTQTNKQLKQTKSSIKQTNKSNNSNFIQWIYIYICTIFKYDLKLLPIYMSFHQPEKESFLANMPSQLVFGGVEVTCEFLHGIHRNENEPFKNSRKEQLNSSIVSSVKLLVSRVSFLFWSIMTRESEKITPPELPLPKKYGFSNVKGSILAIEIPHMSASCIY